jgi:formylglycine-generating enzyme required for sulfatase activity
MTCCTPSHDAVAARTGTSRSPAAAGADDDVSVALPGGTFAMGEESAWSYPADGEGPVRPVTVAPFCLDAHAVTNDRFARFVDATGHVTDAERFGWSFVFAGLLPDDFPATRGVAAAPWWRQVEGASWRTPEGPQSDLAGRGDHPVVQVSALDAAAFAAWAGKRLPTEAEWEYAARAGSSTTFPWGDELEPGGEPQANVWQGEFPTSSTRGTCPVDAFSPNGFGLSNMIGNVWEWTADVEHGGQLLKGGSYLCHESYCRRYRPAARSRASADSSMGNTGFRCAS